MTYDTDPFTDDLEEVRVVGESDKRPLTLEEIVAQTKNIDDGARLRQKAPARSRAQEHRDTILQEAEDLIREGRDKVLEGIEIFAVVEEPQHKNLDTILGQALEQVITYRQMRK